MPYTKAETVLRGQGLHPIVTFQTGSEATKFKVTNQVPTTGDLVKKNDVVHLTVSRGPKPVLLDYFIGDSLDQVKGQIKAAGFHLHVVYKVSPNAAVPAGTVLGQSLTGGYYPYGTAVTLTVARGLKLVELPLAKAIVAQAITPVRICSPPRASSSTRFFRSRRPCLLVTSSRPNPLPGPSGRTDRRSHSSSRKAPQLSSRT